MKQLRLTVVSLFPGGPLPAGLVLAASLLAAGLVACDQKTPAQPPSSHAPYDPLAEGAWWDYQHDDWTEHVTMAPTTLDGGESAFVMTDSPNPKDSIRSDA